MKEINGNCWDFYEKVPICVLTNMTVYLEDKEFTNQQGEKLRVTIPHLNMGGGQARQALDMVPHLDEIWGAVVHLNQRIESVKASMATSFYPLIPYVNTSSDTSLRYTLIAFPTKVSVADATADIDLIKTSAEKLMEFLNLNPDISEVILPRPGCGIGGLDWDSQVRPVIDEIVDDRVTVITF